jgi:hypothetical protein
MHIRKEVLALVLGAPEPVCSADIAAVFRVNTAKASAVLRDLAAHGLVASEFKSDIGRRYFWKKPEPGTFTTIENVYTKLAEMHDELRALAGVVGKLQGSVIAHDTVELKARGGVVPDERLTPERIDELTRHHKGPPRTADYGTRVCRISETTLALIEENEQLRARVRELEADQRTHSWGDLNDD